MIFVVWFKWLFYSTAQQHHPSPSPAQASLLGTINDQKHFHLCRCCLQIRINHISGCERNIIKAPNHPITSNSGGAVVLCININAVLWEQCYDHYDHVWSQIHQMTLRMAQSAVATTAPATTITVSSNNSNNNTAAWESNTPQKVIININHFR